MGESDSSPLLAYWGEHDSSASGCSCASSPGVAGDRSAGSCSKSELDIATAAWINIMVSASPVPSRFWRRALRIDAYRRVMGVDLPESGHAEGPLPCGVNNIALELAQLRRSGEGGRASEISAELTRYLAERSALRMSLMS